MYLDIPRRGERRSSRRYVWVLELLTILAITPLLALGVLSSSSLPALTHFVA